MPSSIQDELQRHVRLRTALIAKSDELLEGLLVGNTHDPDLEAATATAFELAISRLGEEIEMLEKMTERLRNPRPPVGDWG